MTKSDIPDRVEDAPQNKTLLVRFVKEFVAPRKQEGLLMALRRSPVKQKALDYERYLREDRTVDVTGGESFSGGSRPMACIRFASSSTGKPVAPRPAS